MSDRAEEGTVWQPEQHPVADTCAYCGIQTWCKDEPFGGMPSCRPCFFQIIDGEDD